MKNLLWRNQRFLLYCIIGFSGVTLDTLVYSLLVKEAGMGGQQANAISYASGTLLSFGLNARYNFKARDWLFVRFLSFCLVALLGWAASAGLLYWLMPHWGKIPAKLLTLPVVVLLQYNLNRWLSFRAANPAAHG